MHTSMITVVEKNKMTMMNLLVLLLPVLVVVIITAGMKLLTASTTNRSYVLSVDAFSYDFPARQQQHQQQHQHHRSPSSFVLRIDTKDMNNAVHFSSSFSMLSLSSSFNDDNNEENKSIRNNSMDSTITTYSRRQAFQRSSAAAAAAVPSAAGIVAGIGGIGSMMVPVAAANAATTTSNNDSKQLNLSNYDIMKIIQKDMTENQFLVNGQLTRSIYDESSTFQDEIDTYQLDKWIDGTSKLFDSSRSKVVLVDNSLQIMSNPGASSESSNMMNGIEFRFVEYLCFNIPFVKPIVYLSGKLELKRNPETGLITSYQEKWDQNIYEVLSKKSKLFSSNISNQELDNELDLFYKMNANNISKK